MLPSRDPTPGLLRPAAAAGLGAVALTATALATVLQLSGARRSNAAQSAPEPTAVSGVRPVSRRDELDSCRSQEPGQRFSLANSIRQSSSSHTGVSAQTVAPSKTAPVDRITWMPVNLDSS